MHIEGVAGNLEVERAKEITGDDWDVGPEQIASRTRDVARRSFDE